MDVKVITRHTPSNYGSLLQSIATITIVERLGHKCSVIDYHRVDEGGLNAILLGLQKKEGWSHNWFKKALYIFLRYPEEKIAARKFESMRKRFLQLTQPCSTLADLSDLQADIFMTGSDQVWGPVLNGTYDEAYFLSFAKNAKKIAYAASFGRTDFMKNILYDYHKLLSTYDAITVRENTAVDLLKDIDIPCYGQVLDPTLLLTDQEWTQYIQKDIVGKYVLVYQLHNNPQLNMYAKKFADSVGLPLYRISPSLHQITRGGKFIYLPDLGDFLSFIKNCTYFITDSFHGTDFALIFNKQFVEILPNNNTGSRNQSILQLTGLMDRIIIDFNDFSIANQMIDYEEINQIIEEERLKSIQMLKSLC